MTDDNTNPRSNRTRRAVLQSSLAVGAVATGVGAGAVVGEAGGEPASPGAKEIGIQRAVRQRTSEHDMAGAVGLLDRHGVEYTHADLGSDGPAPPTDAVESRSLTDGVFNKSESDIDFLMYNAGGRLYTCEIVFDHEPVALDTDCVAPNDLLAFTFSDARWQYEPGSKNIISGDLRHFDSRPEGAKIEWYYDAYPAEGETSGHFVVLLRKAEQYEGDPSNIWAHYKHVYTPWYKFGCYNGLLGTNVSVSAGNVSISLDADDWEKNTVRSL